MTYQELLIAEKPSVAKEVANHIAKKSGSAIKDCNRYLELSNGIAVTWCSGHLYKLAMPEHYRLPGETDPPYPTIPKHWILLPKDEKALAQIKLIERLIRQSKRIVNLGDPDREGQLLVDEVLTEAGVDADGSNVFRIWVNAMDTKSIEEALRQIKPNEFYRGYRLAALSRTRADWLIGMNGSKGLQKACGVRKGVSMGRVQSPVLGIVAQRCDEIAAFKSIRHYVPCVTMQDGTVLKWRHNNQPASGIDAEGRLVDQSLARSILEVANGSSWEVTKAESSVRSEPPPLPHSLDSLQGLFGKRGAKASSVLAAVQRMYSPEGGKILSYPRVDTRYLPVSMLEKRKGIIAGIAHLFEKQLSGADLTIQGKAYNDKKVTAHHAIIPTGESVPLERLSLLERDIYLEVVRCFIAQMYPDARYAEFDLELSFAGELFANKASALVAPGWMSHCALPPHLQDEASK